MNMTADFSVEIDKPVLKFMKKEKGSRITKTIFNKNNKFGRLRLAHFKTYYKAIVIPGLCSMGVKIDTEIKRTELRVQK